jgi:hypothetical protein
MTKTSSNAAASRRERADGSPVGKRWGRDGRSGRSYPSGVAHLGVLSGAWAGLMRPACAARFGLGPVKLRGSAREQEQSVAYAAQVHVGF